MRCLSKSSDPSTQVHIHYYSSYRICTEQTKTLWRAHISSWGNFTHFWGMFVVPFSPLHINHLSDHAQISLCVSSWRRLNNHCATKFWSLVRADLPTSGSCSFFTWLWLNSSFQSSTLILYFAVLQFVCWQEPSPSGSVHQSLLKPHNSMFTSRVTVTNVFFLDYFLAKAKKKSYWTSIELTL